MRSSTFIARSSTEVRVAALVSAGLLLLLVANLGRISIFSTGDRDIPILVNDLVLLSVIVLGLLAMAQHRTLVADRVVKLALLFAAVGAMSAVLAVPRFGLSPFEIAVSLGYLARWLFYFAIYVVVINTVRAGEVEAVWRALETTILIFAAFGVFQSAFLPDFAQTVYPDSRRYTDWDPQGHRLVSTFLDPNFAGAFIAIGLLVSIARLAAGARVGSWKLILLLGALLLTASRSSVLALLVGGFTILLIRGLSKRTLRALVAGVFILAAASPKLIEFARAYNKLQIDQSALARLESWAHGLQVLSDHPVIGIGFNTWGFVQERYGWPRLFAATYGIEGGFLFIAVMTGFVGLAVYIAMLGAVFQRARRVWKNGALSANHRGIAIGAVAIIPAIVVHGLFVNSLMLPYLMETNWVLWALVACIDRGQSNPESVEPPQSPALRVVALADAV